MVVYQVICDPQAASIASTSDSLNQPPMVSVRDVGSAQSYRVNIATLIDRWNMHVKAAADLIVGSPIAITTLTIRSEAKPARST